MKTTTALSQLHSQALKRLIEKWAKKNLEPNTTLEVSFKVIEHPAVMLVQQRVQDHTCEAFLALPPWKCEILPIGLRNALEKAHLGTAVGTNVKWKGKLATFGDLLNCAKDGQNCFSIPGVGRKSVRLLINAFATHQLNLPNIRY